VKPLGFIGRAEKFESQKASVSLSQFITGQNRYLFLRCLVNGDKPEVGAATPTIENPLLRAWQGLRSFGFLLNV